MSFRWSLSSSVVLTAALASAVWLIHHVLQRPVTVPEIRALSETPALYADYGGPLSASLTNDSYPLEDQTFIRGILHRHTQKKDMVASLEDSLGGAVCVIDFDNDGWDDLFFVTGAGNTRYFGRENWWFAKQPNRLYRNQQGLYFNDVSETAGFTAGIQGYSCAAADFDQDGWTDLVIATKGANELYRNLGNGRFELQGNAFPDDPQRFSTSILIKDFNGDGLPDLLFGNYVTFHQDQNVLEKNSGFQVGFSANFDVALYDSQPDSLYINEGNLRFRADDGALLHNNPHGRTLAFIEAGPHQEVVALNDRGSPSQLIHSPSARTSPLSSVLANARDAILLDDPELDPNRQVLVATDAAKGGLLALSIQDRADGERSWEYRLNTERHLFASGWALLHEDFNGDGRKDLFVANGLSVQHPDSRQTSLGQPNSLLLAEPTDIGLTFRHVQSTDERVLSSRGAAALDFDNDGRLDIVVANNNDYATLLTNIQPHHKPWIGFRCVPQYLCETLDLEISGRTHASPFQRKQHFMGQSASLLRLTDVTATSVTLLQPGRAPLQLPLPSPQGYYLIDLRQPSLTPLVKPTTMPYADVEDSTFVELFAATLRHTTPVSDPGALIHRALTLGDASKLHLLEALQRHRARAFFPLADAWANSDNPQVALVAIETLQQLEMEESLPTLTALIGVEDAALSCAVSRTLERFFWHEEAVAERKFWAVAELVRELSRAHRHTATDEEKLACMLDALGESESIRALQPLTAMLDDHNDWLASRAARSLGRLRQTTAIPALRRKLESSQSPFVTAQVVVALTRLKAELSAAEIERGLPADPWFTSAFLLAVEQYDDGVAIDPALLAPIRQRAARGYGFLTHLPVKTLFDLYQQSLTEPELRAQLARLAGESAPGADEFAARLSWGQFAFLQSRHADSSWLAALYKRLDSAGQRQALETFAGQLLEPLFELDPPQIARHCEAHPAPAPLTRLCGLLRQLDRAPLRELGDTLLPVAQSDQAPLLGQLARLRYGQRSYMLTLARLLNIEQLTPSQRQTLALTLPVHADLLPALQRLFTDLEPAGQLQLLDRLEKGLAGDALRAWLDQLNPRAMPQSTRYRIEALQGLSASTGLES